MRLANIESAARAAVAPYAKSDDPIAIQALVALAADLENLKVDDALRTTIDTLVSRALLAAELGKLEVERAKERTAIDTSLAKIRSRPPRADAVFTRSGSRKRGSRG